MLLFTFGLLLLPFGEGLLVLFPSSRVVSESDRTGSIRFGIVVCLSGFSLLLMILE